jgi:hypothetical protein
MIALYFLWAYTLVVCVIKGIQDNPDIAVWTALYLVTTGILVATITLRNEIRQMK